MNEEMGAEPLWVLVEGPGASFIRDLAAQLRGAA
jgi:hypothetical protein